MKTLQDKVVMSDEGAMLGTLKNITAETTDGRLIDIIVEPSKEIDPRLYPQNNDGMLIFPFANIKSIKDVMVIKAR
jgi:sporulation protein YlmC with PRC-barrel domain